MLGELGNPGVYPLGSETSNLLSREDLLAAASSKFASAKRGQDANLEQLWPGAMSQVGKNWLRGPHRYCAHGELRVDGRPIAGGRFDVQ